MLLSLFHMMRERRALEHCNFVLCCLLIVVSRKRYSKHFTYRDIPWQLRSLSQQLKNSQKKSAISIHIHTNACIYVWESIEKKSMNLTMLSFFQWFVRNLRKTYISQISQDEIRVGDILQNLFLMNELLRCNENLDSNLIKYGNKIRNMAWHLSRLMAACQRMLGETGVVST